MYFCTRNKTKPLRKPIHNYSLGYSIARPIVQFAVHCHYANISVHGRKHLPKDGRYILAPCHQNGLMDPLLILCAVRKPVVFLCRADLFSTPAINAIFRFLKILPIHRRRDGLAALSLNGSTFDQSQKAILSGMPVCIMPEGTHNDKHQLLPLSKGIFRIALQAQQFMGDQPLFIVPVGIDYSDYESPFSSAVVNIGKPINVLDYLSRFNIGDARLLNCMRQDLEQRLISKMHHAATDRYADEYAYCQLSTPRLLNELGMKNNDWGRFCARRAASKRLAALSEPERSGCLDRGHAYAERAAERGIPMWCASSRPTYRGSVAIILSFIFLVLACAEAVPYYVASNLIPFIPTAWIPQRKVQDPQFRSSVNFGIRFGLTLAYMACLFLSCWIFRNIALALAMLLLGTASARLTPKAIALLRRAYFGLK